MSSSCYGMDDAQAREWEAAQAVSISVDLVASARQELQLLANVDRNPCLYGGPAVTRAIERYKKCWLPLLAGEGKDLHKGGLSLIPPLECAWIWHCHRLNPGQYARDCKEVYGRLLDAPLIHAADKQAAVDATVSLWSSLFRDEPYNLDLSQFPIVCTHDEESPRPAVRDAEEHEAGNLIAVEVQEEIAQSEVSRSTADYLTDAVSRQKSFYYQVSRPYTSQVSFLKAAEQRYKGFLHLFSKTEGRTFLVPTYEIDIMWHAHQLCPAAYSRDTSAIVGRLLEHNDTFGDRREGEKLDTGFKDTCELWEQTFGTIYIKAGGMFRGDLPQPIPPPDLQSKGPPLENDSVDYLEEITQQQTYLSGRQTVQVCLVLMSARNVPTDRAGPTLFVRLKALHKCSAFKLDTHQVPTLSDPEWKHMLMLQVETSTDGIVLELRSSPRGLFKSLRESKLIGEATLTWHTLLASASLSVTSWLPLSSQKLSYHSKSMKPPALQIAASITPPISAPYLCRTIKAPATDDHGRTFSKKGHHEGRWITRTVLDHADKQIFVVRVKYAQGKSFPKLVPADQREVLVHQGAWKSHMFHNYNEAPERVAAKAMPIVDAEERERSPHSRRWALYGDAARLTVSINAEDHSWDLKPQLDLQGCLGYPMRLVVGRKLEYEVKNATDAEEAGFVTIIRYTPDAPLGRATALFNWQSAAMEVVAEETVALVVLCSILIALSVFDMLGVRHIHAHKRTKKKKIQGRPHGNEWGAVVIEKAANRRSSMARKSANHNMLNHHHWWDMSPLLWSSSFYCNPDLLTDDGAPEGDAHPLGGDCGAGAHGAEDCGFYVDGEGEFLDGGDTGGSGEVVQVI